MAAQDLNPGWDARDTVPQRSAPEVYLFTRWRWTLSFSCPSQLMTMNNLYCYKNINWTWDQAKWLLYS